jgi:hypothetical protein
MVIRVLANPMGSLETSHERRSSLYHSGVGLADARIPGASFGIASRSVLCSMSRPECSGYDCRGDTPGRDANWAGYQPLHCFPLSNLGDVVGHQACPGRWRVGAPSGQSVAVDGMTRDGMTRSLCGDFLGALACDSR